MFIMVCGSRVVVYCFGVACHVLFAMRVVLFLVA